MVAVVPLTALAMVVWVSFISEMIVAMRSIASTAVVRSVWMAAMREAMASVADAV